MPRGDRTGPAGAGSKTGRAAGYCAGYSVPGYLNPLPGRGFGRLGGGRGRGFFGPGRGMGRGRGFAYGYSATGLPGWARYGEYAPEDFVPTAMTPARESELLKNQARYLQDDLNAVNKRIKELETHTAEQEKQAKET
jgi:hypothetical protein